MTETYTIKQIAFAAALVAISLGLDALFDHGIF